MFTCFSAAIAFFLSCMLDF
uniref:Uncharacterized protein n=1 Tax=Arundo donax TaxID=35708 RepID=A0A0A9ADM2_ARUDO